MNYHNKSFKTVSNSSNGETSSETRFHYQQENEIITAYYSGGNIKKGQLLGSVNQKGQIYFSYQQINLQGEIMTGKCISTPEILPNGKLRLFEEWEWTSGDYSKGNSVIEEI